MKLGIVSDSHGNFENLRKFGTKLKEKHKVDMIIHLGDDSHEIDILKDLPVEILKVPGVYEECYREKEVSNRIIEVFLGWKCLLTHTKESHKNDRDDDIKPEDVVKDRKADLIFYGHSHIPDIEEEEGILFVNPGHLKTEDKKGYPPTYGLTEITPGEIKVQILELDNDRVFKTISIKKS